MILRAFLQKQEEIAQLLTFPVQNAVYKTAIDQIAFKSFVDLDSVSRKIHHTGRRPQGFLGSHLPFGECRGIVLSAMVANLSCLVMTSAFLLKNTEIIFDTALNKIS